MKDWVINLTVVLADGTVIKTKRRPRKTSAGYNLTTFFVGAEGTLGMVTEVTMKLAPIPQDTSVAIVSFDSIREAATAASSIIRSGIQLAALEFMDDVQVSMFYLTMPPQADLARCKSSTAMEVLRSGSVIGTRSLPCS